MKAYLRLMRVHHYMKNLLVLAALACSGQLFDRAKLLAGAAGFAAFCLVSSAVYIINDIRDRDKDRLHPTKRFRPIASGAVPRNRAVLLAALLPAPAATDSSWQRSPHPAAAGGTRPPQTDSTVRHNPPSIGWKDG